MYMYLIFLMIFLLKFLIIRCFYLILTLKKRSFVEFSKKNSFKTMIVIGSGGHTTELLRIVRYLDSNRFSPRIYILSDSDNKSMNKILTTETQFCKFGTYEIHSVPRSREVCQSYFTSIFTTLKSFLCSIPVMFSSDPDLILCNGPGTCVPICFISFIMRSLFLSNSIIIFIESICRVKTLSLSGKILIYFADRVIVQWKELNEKYRNTVYISDFNLNN